MLYNDAYRAFVGTKHPTSLGQNGRDCWPEIWHIIGPMLEGVLERGEATRSDDLLLLLERHGYPEECYFTFSYSPIHDESGGIGGVFTPVHETTERVIGERRLRTLRALASAVGSKDDREACECAAAILAENPYDLPFVSIYLYQADRKKAVLMGTAGIGEGSSVCASPTFSYEEGAEFLEAADSGVTRTIEAKTEFGSLPCGAWGEPPRELAIVPILMPGQPSPTGFLLAGVNPRKKFDSNYQGFVELVAGQVAAALAEARAFQEERRKAEELAELDRAKTLFFSNVSHEFRTPLTLLLGPIEEILQKGEGGVLPEGVLSENLDLLKVAHRNGLRLQKLVNALLDFSRIEAGRAQASYSPTDLALLTTELASSYRSAMERAGLRYEVECPPLSSPVYVDREMWEKVVLNLISNAFKYTLRGSVSLRLVDLGSAAELSVRDTGTGIESAEIPRLFERFHRVEGAAGRTHEGSGIGLALVHELVKLHGGTINVKSSPGEGSTFTVSIPFGSAHLPKERVREELPQSSAVHANSFVEEALRWLPGEAETETGPPEREGAPAAAGVMEKILVADDNADMREYIRRLLEARYQVITAAHGREALNAAIQHTPDLVLSDVMMPVVDGFGLIQGLRAHPSTRSTPVILLWARAGEEASVEGLAAGADDYLVKPFTARELLARVGAHLAVKRERQRAHELLVRVFSQTPTAICVLRGRDLVFELANANYLQLVRRREILGRPLREVMPELDPRTWEVLNRVLDTGEAFVASEFHTSYDQDGDGVPEEHWFNLIYHPLHEGDGSVAGIIGVGNEVTDQVRAREELERVNRELEEFAYVASHDLQEPLRTINIYTQILLKRHVPPGDDEALQFAEFISSSVLRMETLIRDLLSYSQAVHARGDVHGTANLETALSQALTLLSTRIEETGATILREELPSAAGDEAQLAHVFQNLIGNSLKYRKPDIAPLIQIAAEREGKEWIISVADNGIGFDTKYAERIFGLFKRLHGRNYPGTGLGLAICKRIVERCGGRMWAESEPGKGSTFYFALPEAGGDGAG
jgi:PAS domain S-box-containing protein